MRTRGGLVAAAALCLSLIGVGLRAPIPAYAADLTAQGVSAWSDSLPVIVHVDGEVFNSGAVHYQNVLVRCTLVDAGGTTLTETAPIEANILRPGEKAPFDDLFFTGDGSHSPTCSVTGAPTAVQPNHLFTAVITDVQSSPDGWQRVIGTLTNLNSEPQMDIAVILTSYDPSNPSTVMDEGIAWVSGPVDENGGQATFELNADPTRPWDTTHYASLGEAPSPAAELSTDNLTFADQVRGTPSGQQVIHIRNIGTGDLRLDLPTFNGDHPADFAVADDHCSGKTVAAGDVCSLGIVFLPQDVGSRRATLHINDNANGSPDLIALSGNGVARPAVGLSSTTMEFGERTVGTTGQASLQLTSTGLEPVTISSIQLDNPQDFGLDPAACLSGVGLAPGAGCMIQVAFHPTIDGPVSGAITINHDGRASPALVTLSGSGTHAAPAVSLSPDHLAFGQLLVGATSGSQPVTLTNSGVGSLTITNIVASGDYRETNNCGGSLAGRSSCTIMVTFSPGDTGPRQGTLTISDNAGTGSQAIALTGTGTMETDFYFAEGFTAAGFRETLSLFMPNNSGTAAIDYYMKGGQQLHRTVDLAAGRVTQVDVTTVVGRDKEVSVRVALSFPGVVERLMNFQFGGWAGSTDLVGVNRPAKEWDFAEGSTLDFFSEFLTLQNPNATPVTVNLKYMTDIPSVHPVKTVVLDANSRTTIPVFTGNTSPTTSCDPATTCGIGRGFGGVSVQVLADTPIIAERPFYVNGFSFGAGPIRDGHVAFGANAPAKTWNFAEGTTLPGFNEYLTLENPGTDPAQVSLRYIPSSGSPTVRQVTVAAKSRTTVEVFGRSQGVGPGVGGVSIDVKADQPIVAERPMYIVHNFGSGTVAGATVVVGSTSLGNLFGFSAASSLGGENDFLTIQNPGSDDAHVHVTYYTLSQTIQGDLLVKSNTRSTVEVFTASGGGLGRGFSKTAIVILSDQPILVEKATYSAASGSSGATDTLGYSPPSF